MHQPFHQQNVFSADVELVTEKDLEYIRGCARTLLAVARLHEGTYDRDLDGAYQIRHKNEAVLENGQGLQGLALVVIRDLARELPHPLLNLLRGDYRTQVHRFRGRIHIVAGTSEVTVSSTALFSPGALFRLTPRLAKDEPESARLRRSRSSHGTAQPQEVLEPRRSLDR